MGLGFNEDLKANKPQSISCGWKGEKERGQMKISLYDMFHTDTLRDRQTALLIIREICEMPASNPITVDFDKIVFASRSFCHELVMNLRDRKNVSFENVNEEILKMFIAVQTKPHISHKLPTKVMIVE